MHMLDVSQISVQGGVMAKKLECAEFESLKKFTFVLPKICRPEAVLNIRI